MLEIFILSVLGLLFGYILTSFVLMFKKDMESEGEKDGLRRAAEHLKKCNELTKDK